MLHQRYSDVFGIPGVFERGLVWQAFVVKNIEESILSHVQNGKPTERNRWTPNLRLRGLRLQNSGGKHVFFFPERQVTRA